jgi:predicted kinase
MALVVQMHGEPGSGKSTVARALAPRIDAVVLDKDVIKSALLSGGATWERASSEAYEVYFALAASIASQYRALVLDNPVFWPRVEEQWLELSARAGSPPILLECACADDAELRRRLAARPAMASQPREPVDLTRHPGSAATAFEPRLVLNTLRPLPALVDDALRYIEGARGAASASAGEPRATEPVR